MKGFNDIKQFSPKSIKRKQLLAAGGVLGGLVIIVIMLVAFDSNVEKNKIPFDIEKSIKKIEISKIAQGSKTEDRWLQQAEGDLKAVSKQVEQTQTDSKQLEEKVNELTKIILAYEEERKAKENDNSLLEELIKLREEVESIKSGGSRGNDRDNLDPQASSIGIKRIKTHELKLDGEGEENVTKGKKYKLSGYLPAGSYAPAILISGVDASVGVNSQGDPRPVLMRITGEAKSAANDGVIQKIDLEGCTVTGAASGDLSSERVFIRLVKMTCSREDDTAYEAEIQGYVSAVGKAGVRGDVISREGDFVTQSFLAGIISGFGEGAAQKFATPMALPSGLATQKADLQDIAGSGLGKGISSSGNRLSEYLIKRAEQYQPVVSISAGIDVELVFNDGIYIDGRRSK